MKLLLFAKTEPFFEERKTFRTTKSFLSEFNIPCSLVPKLVCDKHAAKLTYNAKHQKLPDAWHPFASMIGQLH